VAQTKKKRRRKHSGTQAGTVDRRTGGGAGERTRTKAESREDARRKRLERLDRPPTWRGAAGRAAIAAAIFAAVVVLAFGRPPLAGLALAVAMFVIYIPMSYFTDRFIYNRRQRRKAAGAGGRKASSER
jgi:hypothetical protein